jgi:hypothetical protein
MIAKNSNKMSERSSRLDIALNRISGAASDVGALAPYRLAAKLPSA